jgi:hypothetical protein
MDPQVPIPVEHIEHNIHRIHGQKWKGRKGRGQVNYVLDSDFHRSDDLLQAVNFEP